MTINFYPGRSMVACHGEKSIVNSPRPQNFYATIEKFIREPRNPSVPCLSRNTLHHLALKRKWTTTTRAGTDESALPTPRQPAPGSTLQSTSDPLTLPKCYTKLPTLQQTASGKTWAANQTRAPIARVLSEKENLIL